MQALRDSELIQAQFLSACYRELFHYCAVHAHEIADNVRDMDDAMRWGFGWQQGPFATWQAFGLAEVSAYIQHSIQQQQSLTAAPLPDWVRDSSVFYSEQQPRTLPVYRRQIQISGHRVLFENQAVQLLALEEQITLLSFKTKANTIGQAVLDGMEEAIFRAEQNRQGLIIYQHDATQFSLGADLREVSALLANNQLQAMDELLQAFQRVARRLKYSTIPVIAALRGRALGGGCELLLQCDGIVAAFESYPGLVETGVGLIPAGGGCKEFAQRAANAGDEASNMRLIRQYFEQIAKATVASCAPDALKRGFLRAGDHWVMHTEEVLSAAIARIKYLQALNYTPPLEAPFAVMGRAGHALLQAGLVNWRAGGFISEHDYVIANALARVLCGGEVNQGQLVDEAWILRLEREAFIQLAMTPLSQARIAHVLASGKPLRN